MLFFSSSTWRIFSNFLLLISLISTCVLVSQLSRGAATWPSFFSIDWGIVHVHYNLDEILHRCNYLGADGCVGDKVHNQDSASLIILWRLKRSSVLKIAYRCSHSAGVLLLIYVSDSCGFQMASFFRSIGGFCILQITGGVGDNIIGIKRVSCGARIYYVGW